MTFAQINAIALSGRSKCAACGSEMRLFGIEVHPDFDGVDLHSYVCMECEATRAEVSRAVNWEPDAKEEIN